MPLVQREDVPDGMAFSQHHDRRIGEPDLQIGIPLDHLDRQTDHAPPTGAIAPALCAIRLPWFNRSMNRSRNAPAPSDDPVALSLPSRFGQRLLVFALRRLGDRASAEDAAQETLRRVVEALDQDRVRDRAALAGFVFETAKHVCQQELRRRDRARQAMARAAREPPSALETTLDQLMSAERRQAVRAALGRLGADDRQLLQLFYARGLDAAEIAMRMRIKPGAVRVRKHRALQRLSTLLNDDETFRPLWEPLNDE